MLTTEFPQPQLGRTRFSSDLANQEENATTTDTTHGGTSTATQHTNQDKGLPNLDRDAISTLSAKTMPAPTRPTKPRNPKCRAPCKSSLKDPQRQKKKKTRKGKWGREKKKFKPEPLTRRQKKNKTMGFVRGRECALYLNGCNNGAQIRGRAGQGQDKKESSISS